MLLSVLIFLARRATVWLIFVANNARKIVAILGFFEALITVIPIRHRLLALVRGVLVFFLVYSVPVN